MATLLSSKIISRFYKIRSSSTNLYKRFRLKSFISSRRYSGTTDNETSSAFSEEATLLKNQKMKIETGDYAKFADGCATVQLGDTSIMATAVGIEKKGHSDSFAPLTVVYHQKAAALGRIPTNFLRREMGQTDTEILISRIIDRSLRPLFSEGFNYETQIICNPLALDGINHADVLAINAASAALAISDIPWNGPVGAVRVGLAGPDLLINPTKHELAESSMNLIVTGYVDNLVVMLEGCCDNVNLNDFMRALKYGIKECRKIIEAISNLQKKKGKVKREISPQPELSPEILEAIKELSASKINEVFTNYTHDKISRDNAISNIRMELLEKIAVDFPDADTNLVNEAYYKLSKNIFRNLILDNEIRCDGRSLSGIRDISCKVDLYKPLHGSALFQRGQTQVFCTVALDSPNSALKLDRVSILTSGLKEKNFFLHYSFPPFATNEIKRTGLSNRREIGHGALAEKGLKASIPENYPFTIRLTSEVLESNGSSSMATVCGGSLALMDAGVPVTAVTAGVAMGLVTKYSEDKEMADYKILTDILGIEDYLGDMDFKIAGTKKGITAVQADIKIPGLPLKIIMETLQKAWDAKKVIVEIMRKALPEPRKRAKACWPVIDKINVSPQKRFKLVGLGGTNIKKIELETGVELTEELDGAFNIFASNQDAMNEARAMIEKSLESEGERNLEFGGIYTAKIVEIRDVGCMVTLYPNMPPALIHTLQLDQRKVSHPSALGLEVGQEIKVKYFGRDPVSGSMRLSRKVLQGPTSEVLHSFVKDEKEVDGNINP